MQYRFNVFGTLMSVRRESEQRRLYKESQTGIRSRVYDVVIPDYLTASELRGYLDDIYHEYSSERYPKVEQLNL
jgi:hypothetical protein